MAGRKNYVHPLLDYTAALERTQSTLGHDFTPNRVEVVVQTGASGCRKAMRCNARHYIWWGLHWKLVGALQWQWVQNYNQLIIKWIVDIFIVEICIVDIESFFANWVSVKLGS